MSNTDFDLQEKIKEVFDDYSGVGFSWNHYLNDLDNVRNARKADKSKVEASPWELEMDSEIPQEAEGRFFTDIGSAHFEGFLHKGSENKLYVMFGGSRSRDGGKYLADIPTFARWSWHTCTKASFLCLEDPMYYTYDECVLGWFYGTKDEDYRRYSAELIKKIADALDISIENIVLYGSSGGGTAAIGTSKYLSGCSVVTINPQLDMTEFHLNLAQNNYIEELEEMLGVNIIDGEDVFGRNNIFQLIQNNKNTKYLFVINVRSEQDFQQQFAYLCNQLSIQPRYGIEKHDNIWTWVYDAYGAPNVHTSYENETIFKMIDIFVDCMKNDVDVREIGGLCSFINEMWFDQYVLKKANCVHQENLKQIKVKLKRAYDEKSEINRKLQQTYEEKSELNRKLQQTYEEKSELNRKLQQTYDEKYERGLQIKELQKRNAKIESKLEKKSQELKCINRELDRKIEELERIYNKFPIRVYKKVKSMLKK